MAVSNDAAMAELHRCAGSHFDPACVDAFERVLGRLQDEADDRPTTAA